MKRTFTLIPVALVSVVLFAGLVYVVLMMARVSEPAEITVHGLTTDRFWATSAALLSLVSVVIGGLALARPGSRMGAINGRMATISALLAGLIAAVVGGLLLAIADGGPGAGNGVVGAAAALVLGLVAAIVAGLALARTR